MEPRWDVRDEGAVPVTATPILRAELGSFPQLTFAPGYSALLSLSWL